MIVRDVMTVNVVTVKPEDTLAHLIETLRRHNYHILPVIDEKKSVIGVVNFQDIMKIFVPHNPSIGKLLRSSHHYRFEEEDILEADLCLDICTDVKVADIMNRNVVSVEEHMNIAEVRQTMKMHNVIRMPVTRDNSLVGFVTLFDIIVALFRERGIIP